MSAEQNKAIARRLYEEAWSKGNFDIIDEAIDANYTGQVAGSPDLRGPEGFKQFISGYRTAFPDIHFTVEDEIAEGDKVVTRWIAHGTHKGELMGIPATGKQITVAGIVIYRYAGGSIVEGWANFDALGMLQQIGVVPMPGQAG